MAWPYYITCLDPNNIIYKLAQIYNSYYTYINYIFFYNSRSYRPYNY